MSHANSGKLLLSSSVRHEGYRRLRGNGCGLEQASKLNQDLRILEANKIVSVMEKKDEYAV